MLPIALALAQFAPMLAGLFGGPKAEDVAAKVVGIAQAVTGQPTPDLALKAVQADPNLALQFQQAVLSQKVQLEQIAMQREKNQLDADAEGARSATERAALLEGTASDLKALPILGPIMLFLRGSQRIVIGFGTIYMDYMVFSAAWKLSDGVQNNAFFMINLLVLAFLFGERALKNVAPLITDMLAARAKV
jgi:hypothetical protein